MIEKFPVLTRARPAPEPSSGSGSTQQAGACSRRPCVDRVYGCSMPTFAVRMTYGPNWDPARGIREQRDWDAHAGFMDGLVDTGFVIIGGPIGEDGALLLVRAHDEAEIHARMRDDPWHRSQLLTVGVVEPWRIWLDGRADVGGAQRQAGPSPGG